MGGTPPNSSGRRVGLLLLLLLGTRPELSADEATEDAIGVLRAHRQRMQSGFCVHTHRGCNQGPACTHAEDAIRVLRAHRQRMQSGSCVHTRRGCNQGPACTHTEDAIGTQTWR